MQDCWAAQPNARPASFEIIARRLMSMRRWSTALREGARQYGSARSFTATAKSSMRRREGSLWAAAPAAGVARASAGLSAPSRHHVGSQPYLPKPDAALRRLNRNESSSWIASRPREIRASQLQFHGEVACSEGAGMLWGTLDSSGEISLVCVREYQAEYLPFSAWILPSNSSPNHPAAAPADAEEEDSLSAARQHTNAVLGDQLAIRSNMWHPNLVQFYGVCLEPPLLIMGMMEKVRCPVGCAAPPPRTTAQKSQRLQI